MNGRQELALIKHGLNSMPPPYGINFDAQDAQAVA